MTVFSDKAKGRIHHFSNGLKSKWVAVVVGAEIGYATTHDAHLAAGGLAVFCTAFTLASVGAIASEVTKKHEHTLSRELARDWKQDGLAFVLLASIAHGMVTASDYKEYMKEKEKTEATSLPQRSLPKHDL